MKEGASYGEYRIGKILLDVSMNNSMLDSYITKIHELMHGILCGNNSCGFADSLFEVLCQDEEIETKLKKRFKQIKKIFFDRSIQVHESLAVFVELEYAKSFDEKKYEELKQYYRTDNKTYYVQFRYRELEYFHGCKDAVEGILNIANAAMEINLCQLKILEKSVYKTIKKNELKYDPNKRFWKAIKYIKKNNIPIGVYKNEEVIKELFKKLDIDYNKKMSNEELYQWGQRVIFDELIPDKDIHNYVYLFSGSSEEVLSKMIQSSGGYISVAKYQTKICTYNDLMEQVKNPMGLFWLDQRNMNVYINTYCGCIYCYINDKLDYIDNVVNQPICFDRNHYEYYMNKYKVLKDKFKIIDIAGIDIYGETFLIDKSSKEMFGVEINNTTLLLFFIGKDKNELLAQALPKDVFLELFTNGILKGYEFVNPFLIYDSDKIMHYCDDYALYFCQDKIEFDENEKKENMVWIFKEK